MKEVSVKDKVKLDDGRSGKVVALMKDHIIQIKYKKKVISIPLDRVEEVY